MEQFSDKNRPVAKNKKQVKKGPKNFRWKYLSNFERYKTHLKVFFLEICKDYILVNFFSRNSKMFFWGFFKKKKK